MNTFNGFKCIKFFGVFHESYKFREEQIREIICFDFNINSKIFNGLDHELGPT